MVVTTLPCVRGGGKDEAEGRDVQGQRRYHARQREREYGQGSSRRIRFI